MLHNLMRTDNDKDDGDKSGDISDDGGSGSMGDKCDGGSSGKVMRGVIQL